MNGICFRWRNEAKANRIASAEVGFVRDLILEPAHGEWAVWIRRVLTPSELPV